MVNEREKNIEQVAISIMNAHWQEDYYSAREYAREVNATCGWNFDVHYGGEGPNNWTRVEGLQLSAGDLEQAVTLATLWSQGYYINEIPADWIDDSRMLHAIRDCQGKGAPFTAYRISNSNCSGTLLWCSAYRRAGVALGGPVQWTDADSPVDALARRLALDGKAMCN